MQRFINWVLYGTYISTLLLTLPVVPAFGWGDEGHEVVALIAKAYLSDVAESKISDLLAEDLQGFKMHDGRMTNSSFATQATWADYYKESGGHQGTAFHRTHFWHFADIELNGGSLAEACFHFPGLPAGRLASKGAPDDCVVDKINQFTAELGSENTPKDERLLALKFLLHFIGDVHQPLHVSDDNDAGGNDKNVTASGLKAGNLHHYWDTVFVLQISETPEKVADILLKRITPDQFDHWSSSNPETWANEAFALAKRKAYDGLPTPTLSHSGAGVSYHLPKEYIDDARNVVAIQLSRAGVRLATTLNSVFR